MSVKWEINIDLKIWIKIFTTIRPCFPETFLHTQLLYFVQDVLGLTQILDMTFYHPK